MNNYEYIYIYMTIQLVGPMLDQVSERGCKQSRPNVAAPCHVPVNA